MKVSVIIPVYNRRSLLPEALESVEQQGYSDYEVIIADDGSDDGTAEVAGAWLDHRKRTAVNHSSTREKRGNSLNERNPMSGKNHASGGDRILSLDHSGFPGMVRNRAADSARGDWIAFLDSDDLWEPEKLEKQISLAEARPDIRIWHCRETWLRGDKIVSQRKQRHQRSGWIFKDALKKCIIGPSTVLIRRDLWQECGGFREDLEIAEDYQLWLRITACEELGYLDEPLTVKRAGDWDQLSEKYDQIEIFRMEGLSSLVKNRWFREHADEKTQLLAEEELLRKYRIYARGCRKRGKLEEAEHYESLGQSLSP